MGKGKSNIRKHVRGPFCTIPNKVTVKKSEGRQKRAKRAAEYNEEVRKQIELDYAESDEDMDDAQKAKSEQSGKTPSSSSSEKPPEKTQDQQAEAANEAASGDKKKKKMGKDKAKRFERLKKEGFFEQTEKTVEQLMKCKGEVEFALEDCWDEERLRRAFPQMGTMHKYFQSGKFKIKYLLSKDDVPVCQIVKLPRV